MPTHSVFRFALSLALLSAGAVSGCSDSKGSSQQLAPDADASDASEDVFDGSDSSDSGSDATEDVVEPIEMGTLERVSPQSEEVDSGDIVETTVRFVDVDGNPVNDVPIDFTVLSAADAGGAQYDFGQVMTGFRADTGIAVGELETARAAVFQVRASSEFSSNTIDFNIKVNLKRVAVYEFTAVSNIEMLEKDSKGATQNLIFDEILIAPYRYKVDGNGNEVVPKSCEQIETEIWQAGINQDAIRAARPGGATGAYLIKPAGGNTYDTQRINVTLPNAGNVVGDGDPADARSPLRYAVAFGYVGQDSIFGYDCVELPLPGASDEFFQENVTFDLFATYPDVSDQNYDITTYLDLKSAIPNNAEDVVDDILGFLTDPAVVFIQFLKDELLGEDTGGAAVDAIINQIASSLFQQFTEGTVVETITEVAADVKLNVEEFKFDGKFSIAERPDQSGLLTGDNSLLLNTLYVDLRRTTGVNDIVSQNIGDTFSAAWSGRVAVARRTQDGVDFGLVIEPFDLDFAYGELLEILIVKVALNAALNQNFDDLSDVAAEYIECNRWIRDAACEEVNGRLECDAWVNIAVVACEAARDFAVDLGRDELLGLSTDTGDFFTLQTDPTAVCEIHEVNTTFGKEYKFGNESGAERPTDSCIWDGAIRYSDSGTPEEFDGTFYVKP